MSNNAEIDVSKLQSLLDNINDELSDGIVLKGLQAGGKVLVKNTQETMLQKIPFASTAKGKAKKPMVESISVKTDKDYNKVIISIMKNYLNIFFENGTDERYRKTRGVLSNGKSYRKDNTHNGYTGKIEGKHFFKEARENSENEVIEAIKASISKQLNKLFKQ